MDALGNAFKSAAFEEALRLRFNLLLLLQTLLSLLLVRFIVSVSKCGRIETTKVFVKLRVLPLHLVSDGVNVLELPRELRQALEEFLDNNDAEALPLPFSAEGLDDKLQSDVLQDAIEKLVLDNCTKELGNLLQVLLRVPV